MDIIQPSKEELNQFVLENHGSFQQSWQWGELQERMGRKTNRLLIIDNNNRAVAAALFVKHNLPLGKYYWLCPRGPVWNPEYRIQNTEKSLEELFGKLEGIFVRIEPQILNSGFSILDSALWRKAPKDHNPRATILVNLEKTEEQLLAEMHPKTRYNLRLAEKKGVNISDFRLQIADFLELMKKTAKRDRFHLHPKKYYEELLKMPEIKLFGAYYEDKLVAAAMVSFWADKAAYMHGASDYEYRNLMAPYLLHWEIIRQAKKEGLKYYDLGGIAPKSEANHAFAGITRFKAGFGGTHLEYIGSYDYVLNKLWYAAYKLVRKIMI